MGMLVNNNVTKDETKMNARLVNETVDTLETMDCEELETVLRSVAKFFGYQASDWTNFDAEKLAVLLNSAADVLKDRTGN